LLHGAHIITHHHLKGKFHLCSIINAKSGRCSEDCKFCAQSAHHNTGVKTYPLAGLTAIKKGLCQAAGNRRGRIQLVTSGQINSPAPKVEIPFRGSSAACPGKATRRISASPSGAWRARTLAALKKAGVSKFHHNLETSRRFFPKICSSHSMMKTHHHHPGAQKSRDKSLQRRHLWIGGDLAGPD